MSLHLPTLTEQELTFVHDGEEPGFGTLSTTRGRLPLTGLEVRGRVDGLIASLEVRQTFINTLDESLEATYIFPLPPRAAVTRFRLQVAGRIVEGELQEREQARKTYAQAIQDGHRAALAEEERPGVFTMRVGNLPPGERAVVQLDLVGPLPYADGEVTFRFPLVVAPRYIPGTSLPGPNAGAGVEADTDAVPDASRISPPTLLPGFPNPVQLNLSLEVRDAGMEPTSFRSSLHTVTVEHHHGCRRFRLEPGERLDRDFILRWRLGGDEVRSSLLVQQDASGGEGTFALTLVPPSGTNHRPTPRAVCFVLDRSGSMGGWKMVAARRAVARMVETLNAEDRFSVYAFDTSMETPPGFDGYTLEPATDTRRFRVAEWLGKIEARGGTEMLAPLEQGVTELGKTDLTARERILVLITDGQVGNEDQILKNLGNRLRGTRVFTLGIDRAVNEAFLKRLADLGQGSSEVVESETRLAEVMEQIHRHISTPVLTGVSLLPGGLEIIADSLTPARLPDLFAGTPLLINGRYRGLPGRSVQVQARDARGERWSATVQAWSEQKAPLGVVWARGRVRDLEDRHVVNGQDDLKQEIIKTSLQFGVLSKFTAFVAVDRAEVVNLGGENTSILQPVDAPSGWAAPPGVTSSAPGGARQGGFGGNAGGHSSTDSAPRRYRGIGPAKSAVRSESNVQRLSGETSGMLSELFGLLGIAGQANTVAREQARPATGTVPAGQRQRVEAILRAMEQVKDDSDAQLAFLRRIHAELEQLLVELAAANDQAGLDRAWKAVQAILSQAQASPGQITQAFRSLREALEGWLQQTTQQP